MVQACGGVDVLFKASSAQRFPGPMLHRASMIIANTWSQVRPFQKLFFSQNPDVL